MSKPTQKPAPGPEPRGFVENAFYENLAHIKRTDQKRFFLFSPASKHALSVYLSLKERYAEQPPPTPAARAAA
jgi:hypothetical protein